MSAAPKEAAAPTFDIDAIRAHVAMLHSFAAGVDGVFVVTVLYADAGSGPLTHHRVGHVEGMVASIMAHATTPGANIYNGLHLMRPNLEHGKRGGKADIIAVLGLVADQDADTGKVGEMPVEPS